MKLFEVTNEGKTFGYVVGQNGVEKITKNGKTVVITVNSPELGVYLSTFDLNKFAMYSIG